MKIFNKTKILVLLAVFSIINVADCQLSSDVQQHLKKLANQEIIKQIVNGSNDKTSSITVQSQKSLQAVVQAGQVLSYLNVESEQKDKVCKWVAQVDQQLPKNAPETVFLKAESLRLFKCPTNQLNVVPEINEILNKPTTYLHSVNDYFNAFMINKRAKHYGVQVENSASTEFFKHLLSVIEKQWIEGFSLDSFQLVTETQQHGLTSQSINLLEMVASVVKDKNFGNKAQTKVQKALQKIIAQASAVSSDVYSENQIFFVAPKNARDHNNFDLTQINLHVLNTIIEAKKAIKMSDIKFDEEYFSLYKNYFESKATSALTIQTAFYALRGLKSQNDQVFLKDIQKSYFVSDGSVDFVSYDLQNSMGKVATVKGVKKATMVQINNGKETDITGNVQFPEGKVVVKFEKKQITDMPWTSHIIKFQFETSSGASIYVTKTFEVKTTLVQEIGVSVSQNSNYNSPDHYQFKSGYPKDFNNLNTLENPYLHIQIQTQFNGDKDMQDQPQSVFITLQREDQIPYTVHADYLPNIQRYQIMSDLRTLMREQVNGDYKMQVHVQDPRAVKSFVKDLGSVQINFNEGSMDNENFGIREDYRLYDKITNYFPPEEPEKSALIPLVFSGVLGLLFFYFFTSLFSNGANLTNLSFWGMIFLVNYFLILAILVAFWIGQAGPFKMNLVVTLWVLVAAAPFTLFTMNMGLTPEDCHVSGFQLKESKSKKQN